MHKQMVHVTNGSNVSKTSSTMIHTLIKYKLNLKDMLWKEHKENIHQNGIGILQKHLWQFINEKLPMFQHTAPNTNSSNLIYSNEMPEPTWIKDEWIDQTKEIQTTMATKAIAIAITIPMINNPLQLFQYHILLIQKN